MFIQIIYIVNLNFNYQAKFPLDEDNSPLSFVFLPRVGLISLIWDLKLNSFSQTSLSTSKMLTRETPLNDVVFHERNFFSFAPEGDYFIKQDLTFHKEMWLLWWLSSSETKSKLKFNSLTSLFVWMNISSFSCRKIMGQAGLFSLALTTRPGEVKLWIQISFTRLKKITLYNNLLVMEQSGKST